MRSWVEAWIDPDVKRARRRGLKGALMEDSGKPSGGRIGGPLSSSCVSRSHLFFLSFLLLSPPPPHLTLFQGVLFVVGTFAWMLVVFNLDNLQRRGDSLWMRACVIVCLCVCVIARIVMRVT